MYAARSSFFPRGHATDAAQLARRARSHGMAALLSNVPGFMGGRESSGRSAAWAPDGSLVASAPPRGDALVMLDLVPVFCVGEVITLDPLRPDST